MHGALRFRLLLLLGLGLAAPMRADWVPGQRMQTAVGKIIDKAQARMKTDKLYYAYNTCIVAGFLEQEGSLGYTRNFVKGETYYLMAGGDDNAYDLDIEIYDKNDKQVAADTEANNSPEVKFVPAETGEYRMKLILHEANRKTGSFCCLVVLNTSRGYEVHVDNLKSCLKDVADQGAKSDAEVKGVLFHSGAGQMALVGVVLPPQEDEAANPVKSDRDRTILNVVGLSFMKREYVVFAIGDTVAKHLTLELMDSKEKELGKDTAVGKAPLVRFTSPADYFQANMRITNVTSKGPSLCMCVLLVVTESNDK